MNNPKIYLFSSMGSVILVVYGAQRLWERVPKLRKSIMAFGILLIAAGTLKTLTRNVDWSSREALLR